jgi:hypothetical protein
MCGALSDERTSLSFTIAAGPLQRCHSRVRVPRESRPYFTVSDSRLLQPGGPGPRIYIPQQQGGSVMPPGTGYPFRGLLGLTGLRLRYSKPLPHGLLSHSGSNSQWTTSPHYIAPARTTENVCHYCMFSQRGNSVFTELFPSNGCLLFTQLLLGSGSTCHNI